jgi:hypothetical protein
MNLSLCGLIISILFFQPLKKVEPNLPLKKVEPNLPLKKIEPNLPLKKVEPNLQQFFEKW